MLLFNFIVFFIPSSLCFVSVDPTWLTSSFLKSGSNKLIDGDARGGTVGPNDRQTANVTFPGTAFTRVPNLGYGISKYEGDLNVIQATTRSSTRNSKCGGQVSLRLVTVCTCKSTGRLRYGFWRWDLLLSTTISPISWLVSTMFQ